MSGSTSLPHDWQTPDLMLQWNKHTAKGRTTKWKLRKISCQNTDSFLLRNLTGSWQALDRLLKKPSLTEQVATLLQSSLWDAVSWRAGAGRSLRGPLAKRSPSHARWPHGRSPLETRREARADEPALLFADTIPHCGYNHESGKLTPRLAFPPRGFIPSSDVSQTWASEEGHCQVWINQLWSACHCRTWPLGPPRGGDVGSPLTSLIVPDRYFSKVKGELMGKMEVLWVKHHTCACVCVFTSLRRLIPSQEYAHENVKLELSF